MPRNKDRSGGGAGEDAAGPRAILRVPEVLIAVAAMPGGASLAELAPRLNVPKTSLHRLLRTLEQGGYLSSEANLYRLGPMSFQLASLIGMAAPPNAFPACARPVIQWLARETGETVMLGVVTEGGAEILYVDVIDSPASVRFTVPVGDRRPLYSAASGKAVLAFMTPEDQRSYLANTAFEQFTPHTTGRDELAALLPEIAEAAIAFDRDGKIVGASALAGPIFAADGTIFGSVSAAGPTERIAANRAQLAPLVRLAGERISRLLGFNGAFPPQ